MIARCGEVRYLFELREFDTKIQVTSTWTTLSPLSDSQNLGSAIERNALGFWHASHLGLLRPL